MELTKGARYQARNGGRGFELWGAQIEIRRFYRLPQDRPSRTTGLSVNAPLRQIPL